MDVGVVARVEIAAAGPARRPVSGRWRRCRDRRQDFPPLWHGRGGESWSGSTRGSRFHDCRMSAVGCGDMSSVLAWRFGCLGCDATLARLDSAACGWQRSFVYKQFWPTLARRGTLSKKTHREGENGRRFDVPGRSAGLTVGSFWPAPTALGVGAAPSLGAPRIARADGEMKVLNWQGYGTDEAWCGRCLPQGDRHRRWRTTITTPSRR